MNADNKKKLSKQAIEVLKLLPKYPGCTAQELGLFMSRNNFAKYEWPHKIMKRLVDAELVKRTIDMRENNNRKQLRCYITWKGVEFLKGLKDG